MDERPKPKAENACFSSELVVGERPYEEKAQNAPNVLADGADFHGYSDLSTESTMAVTCPSQYLVRNFSLTPSLRACYFRTSQNSGREIRRIPRSGICGRLPKD